MLFKDSSQMHPNFVFQHQHYDKDNIYCYLAKLSDRIVEITCFKSAGNYHIYWYEMCHFWGVFYRAENTFWGVIFGKVTSSHRFWGVIFEKSLFRVSIFIKFHLFG